LPSELAGARIRVQLEPDDSPNHPLAPWFADMRRERRKRRGEAGPGPAGRPDRSRAVITMVHEAPEDIYVLDNDSDPETLPASGFVRIPVAHDRVDHTWMVRTIESLQHELIRRYDKVLVTDVDEIVAPHPRLGDLGDYLDAFREDWVNCLGYELLHQPDREPPLQPEKPILAQRGRWFFNDGYDKAALATTPMSWRPGFHGRTDFHVNLDPDLRLIHLHRVDYEMCLARHRTRSRRPWDQSDARDGWAIHNQITDEADFRQWFHEDSCFANLQISPEPIPPAWHDVF
jgi:hypothetical protein